MLEKTLRLLKQFTPGQHVSDDVQCFDEEELRDFGLALKQLVYAPSQLRKRLQEYGTTITRTDFYSEIPLIKDIEESFRKPSLLKLDAPFSEPEFLKAFLRDLTAYSRDFDPPVEKGQDTQFAWESGMFGYSDAMAYYAMIRRFKPKTIVEIGCGTSTLIANAACERNGAGRVVAFEPYPSAFLSKLPRVELITQRAQDIDAAQVASYLRDGDFLFVDTTHTVKHDSDCLHIYLRILPSIRTETYVHVHDIWLPDALPIEVMRDQQLFWNEQYLLYAYFLGNSNVKTLFGSAYHSKFNGDLLEAFMHGRYRAGGRSFWFLQRRH